MFYIIIYSKYLFIAAISKLENERTVLPISHLQSANKK